MPDQCEGGGPVEPGLVALVAELDRPGGEHVGLDEIARAACRARSSQLCGGMQYSTLGEGALGLQFDQHRGVPQHNRDHAAISRQESQSPRAEDREPVVPIN
jgi:hypothetical protein